MKCQASCTKCSGATNNDCSSCADAFLMYKPNSCVGQCPETYFADDTKTCSSCIKNCVTCLNDQSCMRCADKFVLQNAVCQDKCNDGFFQDDDRTCKQCNKACTTCTKGDIASCNGCYEGFLLASTTCEPGCVAGKYLSDGACFKCDEGCDLCGAAKACTACSSGLFNNDGVCVATCPDGKFGNLSTKMCEKCLDACTKCTGPLISNC